MRTKRMDVSRMVLGVVLLAGISANAAETSTAPLVPDGTVVQATDGTLARSDSNDLWLFQFVRDVNGVGGALPAGSQLQVLPSSILDSMVADANERLLPRYRLSALVTRYRGSNYLFPSYYLPLSKLKDANAPQEEPEKLLDTVPDTDVGPGGPLEIPEEVLDRIRTRRQARGPQRGEAGPGAPGPPAETGRRARTHVLVDRIGFIEFTQGYPVFVPDGLGRNVAETRYELLPCSALEQAERRLAAFPQPIRFNVAGLVTEYQGRKYLLLQRAIRVYNYGNFGR
mgnify:CR=1 FL=1